MYTNNASPTSSQMAVALEQRTVRDLELNSSLGTEQHTQVPVNKSQSIIESADSTSNSVMQSECGETPVVITAVTQAENEEKLLPSHKSLVVEEKLDCVIGIDFLRANSLEPHIGESILAQTTITGLYTRMNRMIHFSNQGVNEFTFDLFWSTYLSNQVAKVANRRTNTIALNLIATTNKIVADEDGCLEVLAECPDLTAIPGWPPPCVISIYSFSW